MSNIQVVVRCRGRNDREIKANSPVVVELPVETYSAANPNVTLFANTDPPSHLTNSFSQIVNLKSYSVDQVYGSQADQLMLFQQVALPSFHDFVAGYNTTLLAYGQTGTGKTYTMCGDLTHEKHGRSVRLSEEAGIVPRVLYELFAALDARDADYSVRCSFMELYNEEIKDLLGPETDSAKLRIFDSTQKRPSGPSSGIVVQNLIEQVVTSAKQALDLLEMGHKRRTTASTRMNDVSSRSHSIFTIYLYKADPERTEMMRVSKMNLVDLAGSENIHKSGAVNQRAKEAGSINQSLLTLGRVINCLSDKSGPVAHIPFRESKLTRLLQDSLGGKTKTTLIATISPAKIDLDETTSTLEYASKAKCIQNKSQSGDSIDYLAKRILVRDISNTVRKLQDDLVATRKKNGIWMDETTYTDFVNESEALRTQFREARAEASGLEMKLEKKNQAYVALEASAQEHEAEMANMKMKMMESNTKQRDLEADMARKNSQIQSMTQTVSELEKNYGRATDFLKTTVSAKIEETVGAVLNIASQVSSEEDLGSLKEARERVSSELCSFQLQLSAISESLRAEVNRAMCDFPSVHKPVEEQLRRQRDANEQYLAAAECNADQAMLANNDLETYLKEQHLQDVENRMLQSMQKRVKLSLTAMRESMVAEMTAMVGRAFSDQHGKLPRLLAEDTKREVNLETQEMQTRLAAWTEKSLSLQNASKELARKFCDDNDALIDTIKRSVAESFTMTSTLQAKLDSQLELLRSTVEQKEAFLSLENLEAAHEGLGIKAKQICSNLEDTTSKLRSIEKFEVPSNNSFASGILREISPNKARIAPGPTTKRPSEMKPERPTKIPSLSRVGSDVETASTKRKS